MSYDTYNWPGFGGGLNLRKVSDGSGVNAIDCMNVTFTNEGGIRSRRGNTLLTTGISGTTFGNVAGYERLRGTAMRHVIASQGNTLRAYDTAGNTLATYTAGTNPDWQFQRWGSSAGEYLIAANGVNAMMFWDGPTTGGGNGWQAITGMAGYSATVAPIGKHISAFQNRLVVACMPGAAAGNCESTVRFSETGNPWSWGTNYYYDVRPGDGERVTAIQAYADQLFVFKRNSIHLIYNVGANSSGGAQIDSRLIVEGVGAVGPNAVTVGPQGVYFAHDSGIYVTKGGEPELLSGPVDPIFKGSPPLEWRGGILSAAYVEKIAMQWHDNQLRVSYPIEGSSDNTRTLAYHTDFGWWTISNLAYRAMSTAPIGQSGRLLLIAARDSQATPAIVYEQPGDITDAGTAFETWWRSDATDFGLSKRKTIGGQRGWGEGAVYISIGTDYREPTRPRLMDFGASNDTWGGGAGPDTWAAGSNASDTWSGGSSVQMRYTRAGFRGTNIQLALRGATPGQSWSLYKSVLHMRAITPTGTKAKDE